MSEGNGCGPEWMPRAFKKALFDWFFEASCGRHDVGYDKGGDEARRKQVDEGFLKAMKRDTMRKRGLQRGIRFVQAYAFYGIVRLFGRSQFNYTKKEN